MELEKQTFFGNWKLDRFLGEGSFGKVYRIIREERGRTYESALKIINIPQSESEIESLRHDGLNDQQIKEYFESTVDRIIEECELMSTLKGNSNIVSYEDHAVEEKIDGIGWRILIRMELLTPLFEYISNNNFLIHDVIQLGIDMCCALELCQKFNIIHRDIKPENIFVSQFGQYKLGDFGIAKQFEKTSSMSQKGTYFYMAPEVHRNEKYNSTVDIYSLGNVS